MPTIYKVHDPRNKETLFMFSKADARKARAQNGDLVVEPLEYQYKWQLIVMMNQAYLQGRDDVLNGMD